MKTILIGNPSGSVICQSIPLEFFEEQTHDLLFKELAEGESTMAHRYAVVDGVITDMYPTLSDAEINQNLLDAVVASTLVFKLTPTDFLRFLGAGRRIAIRGLAKGGDPVAEDMLDMFNRVPYIASDDNDLKQGLAYLASLSGMLFGGANPFAGISEEFVATGKTFVS